MMVICVEGSTTEAGTAKKSLKIANDKTLNILFYAHEE
jgi:hypothetical protein